MKPRPINRCGFSVSVKTNFLKSNIYTKVSNDRSLMVIKAVRISYTNTRQCHKVGLCSTINCTNGPLRN